MRKTHGPWTIEKRTSLYRNAHIEVIEDSVLTPKGEKGMYGFVKINPGAAALPLDEKGFVYLVKQFRYGLGKESIEVAGGGVHKHETPLEAAKRELREELGIKAKEWKHLGFMSALTGTISHREDLFLAQELTFLETQLDDTEMIEVVKMPFMQALAMVKKSDITHGPSCVLILKANEHLRALR